MRSCALRCNPVALRRAAIGAAAFFAVAQPAFAAAPTPRKIFAIAHSDIDDFGNPADTLNFYDVTSIGAGGTNVFNTNSDGFSDPLFSAWIGYEALVGESLGVPAGNDEDPSAIAVNYANGTVYMAAFDSGNGLLNNPDEVGDNQGDWDLYRIDYQKLLQDFESMNRPKGTVYVIDAQPIPLTDEQFMADSLSPLHDGTVDGYAHGPLNQGIPHPDTLTPPAGLDPRPSIVVPGAISKVGELARSPSNNLGVSFFDTELTFVDPETLLVMDTASNLTVAGDFQLRQWKRVSTEPGMAVPDRDGADNMENTFNPTNPVNNDNQTGGRNHMHEGQFATSESWQASILGRFGLDEGETLPDTGDIFQQASDPRGLALVKRDGVLGVWFADGDRGASGDDVAFYEIDLNASPPTLTQRMLANSGAPASSKLSLADNPAMNPSTDDAVIDFLVVDKLGNLVIGESGFFDVTTDTTAPTGDGGFTAEQPKIITIDIDDYAGSEVLPNGGGFNQTAAYNVSANVNPALTDDTQVINNPNQADDNADVAYDRGTGYIYFIDRDADFFEDIYVFDPATGTLIYSELNAINPGFFNTASQAIFLRGDLDDDGSITYADVKAMAGAIADPTLGGEYTSAVGQEFYDLTGDGLLTAADLEELVEGILDTALGDFNIDGIVDGADLALWRTEFGDALDGRDFLDWQRNLGFSNMAVAAVPEPATVGLAALAAALGGVLRRGSHSAPRRPANAQTRRRL